MRLKLVSSVTSRFKGAVMRRGLRKDLRAVKSDLLAAESLDVVLCGTGSPMATDRRAGACVGVFAGSRAFMIDAGPGAWRNFSAWRLPAAALDTILLTHFHSDHIGDLGEIAMQTWEAGRKSPLNVWGPPGVETMVEGFRRAYKFDSAYRILHHGREAMPVDGAKFKERVIQPPEPEMSTILFDEGDLKIRVFAVDHGPANPAFGYRIDYNDRSVTVSGDTTQSSTVAKFAIGTDVLVHSALSRDMIFNRSRVAKQVGLDRLAKITADLMTYHTTPVEAARVASLSHPGVLVLTHVMPPLGGKRARRQFLRGVKDEYDGDLILGSDGLHFRLPVDDGSIKRKHLK